jgi:hypothetical protein
MDKLDRYRRNIESILTHYSQFKPIVGDTERFVSFDRERDHYICGNIQSLPSTSKNIAAFIDRMRCRYRI